MATSHVDGGVKIYKFNSFDELDNKHKENRPDVVSKQAELIYLQEIGEITSKVANKIINEYVNINSKPEWGFPKGRREIKECNKDAAIREFCDETSFKPNEFVLLYCYFL